MSRRWFGLSAMWGHLPAIRYVEELMDCSRPEQTEKDRDYFMKRAEAKRERRRLRDAERGKR